MESIQITFIIVIALFINYFVHKFNIKRNKNNRTGIEITTSKVSFGIIFSRIGTTATLTFVFWTIFNNYLWHWPIWQGWLVNVPVIEGEWIGKIDRVFPEDRKKCFYARSTVKQTSIDTFIKLEIEGASSTTPFGVTFTRKLDGKYVIHGIYRVERAPFLDYFGAFKHRIDFDDKNCEIMGTYWTESRTGYPSMGYVCLNRKSNIDKQAVCITCSGSE